MPPCRPSGSTSRSPPRWAVRTCCTRTPGTPTWPGVLGGQLHGVPHVLTAHSLEPARPWKADQLGGGYRISSWAERQAYETAAAIIAVSAGMRQDVLAAYPFVEPERVHVIHNGIDTTLYAPDRVHRRRATVRPRPTRPSVIFVGRITRQKGLGHLLAAAESFDPSIQLVLCAGAPTPPRSRPRPRPRSPGCRRPGPASCGSATCCRGSRSSNCWEPRPSSSARRSTSRWASSTWRRWRARRRWSPVPSAASPRWSRTA